MKRRTIVPTLLLASLGSATGAGAQAVTAQGQAALSVPRIDYTRRTLPNGLVVLAARDTRIANVALQMFYRVGSKDDPAGRAGLAHLFEHILSRVTRNIPPGELTRMVEERFGGSRNAGTAADFTMYRETVPASYLEATIWTHAERMGRPVLDADVFEAERNIVKEELRQGVLSQPYGRLIRYHLFENGFTTHPYRRATLGSLADLSAATLAEARAFHENFYRPDNAVLVVSGNFDPAALNRYVDRHLATIPRPSRPIVRANAREAPRTAPRTVTAYAPNVPLPAVLLTWQRPPLTHPDGAALDVLSRILSGGQSSRLYQSLVYGKQIAQSASSSNFDLKEAGIFLMQATVAGGRSLEELESQLVAEAARLRADLVTVSELAEAKTEIIAGALFSRETIEGRSEELGRSAVEADDPDFAVHHLARVQRVTADDVRRVARHYLGDDRRVTIRYLDQNARTGAPLSDLPNEATSAALGRTLPPAMRVPNVLAPEAERVEPPEPGPEQDRDLPAFSERRLSNGLRVVVARSSAVPIFSANLVFAGGASADPAGRSGLAAMMTRLVTVGAGGRSAPQVAAATEALGARIGAQAGNDSTSAFVVAPLANAAAAGDLLRTIVRAPQFAAEEVERERLRTVDRLRIDLRQPGTVNALAARRSLYGAAAYGSPTAGTPATVATLNRDEIAAFHRRWWRPDNATLIITGAMDADDAFRVAERLFGDWSAPAEALPAPSDRAGPPGRPRVIVIDMPQADQASVSVSMRAIPRAAAAYYPLLLANGVLGGSQTSRLFQEIRVRRALSYGAYSDLQALRDEGLLIASAQTRNDAAPEVVSVMLAELERLEREPVDADLLQRRKNLASGLFSRQLQTAQGLSAFLSDLAVQGVPMSAYGEHLANLNAVTAQQVASAVAAELDRSSAHIVVAGKASEFLPALRARYPNVEVIPLDQFDPNSASLRASPERAP